MPTLVKYLLFQIPGWLLLTLLLWYLVPRTLVPAWAGIGIFLFWVIKDFAMYPFVRRAYQNDARTGAGQLVGDKGVTHETLAPEGYIKIRGELWKAHTEGESIPRDSRVKVTGARGMTLIVEPD